MNRFLLAKNHLGNGDELVWYRKRPNGEFWKCLWRRGRDHTSFVAQEILSGTDEKGYITRIEGTVKRVFTLVD